MIRATIAVVSLLAVSPGVASGMQPAHAQGDGPLILIDRGHNNSSWPVASMVSFLEQDGYRVREHGGPIDRNTLSDVGLVFIAWALADRNVLPPGWTQEQFDRAWSLPTPSAFSPEEIAILADWVAQGGSILLVLDHLPLAGAGQDLAAAFGIEVSNGFAVDGNALSDLSSAAVSEAGSIVFRRSDGTLLEHPATNGRGPTERVDSVATYTGSAFRLPPGGWGLMVLGPSFVSLLPDVAWVFSEDTPRRSVAGWAQGGVVQVRQGRVAVFGELALLATPRALAADTADAGDNQAFQNPQLLLNTIHWLLGLLDG